MPDVLASAYHLRKHRVLLHLGKRQEAGLLTVIGRIHNPHASMACALHSACLDARVYMSLAGFAYLMVMPSQFLNGRLGMDRASSPATLRLE